MTSRRTKISPKSGRGLGHVTSTIFGSTVGYPSDSLASCSFIDSSKKSRKNARAFIVKRRAIHQTIPVAVAALYPSSSSKSVNVIFYRSTEVKGQLLGLTIRRSGPRAAVAIH